MKWYAVLKNERMLQMVQADSHGHKVSLLTSMPASVQYLKMRHNVTDGPGWYRWPIGFLVVKHGSCSAIHDPVTKFVSMMRAAISFSHTHRPQSRNQQRLFRQIELNLIQIITSRRVWISIAGGLADHCKVDKTIGTIAQPERVFRGILQQHGLCLQH